MTPGSGIPTENQVSSGGVVYRIREGGPDVVVVRVGPGDRWQLPKGLIDSGESPEETAIREVREEAGVAGDLVEPLDVIEYWYVGSRAGNRIRFHKSVHFYLLAYREGEVGDHDHEVREARWVPIAQAVDRLAFESERRVVARARELLVGRRGIPGERQEGMSQERASNEDVAQVMDRIANLLEAQGANPHRVRAYRGGADRVRGWSEEAADILARGGQQSLRDRPGIGQGLASLIAEVVRTGRSQLLQQLLGAVDPEALLSQVPGIGETLAGRIVEELGVHSLEALETAAHDGRLAQVEGFGPRRVQTVRTSLAGILSGFAQREARRRTAGRTGDASDRPGVPTLLDVDAEYRRKAEAGELNQIAPRRFNPENEAWLPILHTERGEWQFTVLFSNTARAHELGTTHDWVVIYYRQDGEEDQATVVTETRGPLEGRRVVRGREEETRRYYRAEAGGGS